MKSNYWFILLLLMLVACSPKSEVDQTKRVAESLKAENAELKASLKAEKAENAELKSQLAKKPALPVNMSLRKAMMGPGYVAKFSTTVKDSVPVIVTVKSAALGTTKRFELHLNPITTTELGHAEGATIEKGDTITIENNNFSPATFVVNVR